MNTHRKFSMSCPNQFRAVGICANPFRRNFRNGRRSLFGAFRTVGIIAVIGWLSVTEALADVTPTPDTLTFTSANWNEPQTVEVEAAHDDDANNEDVILAHAKCGYSDSPAVEISEEELRIQEGGTGTYNVRLAGDPDPTRDNLTVTVKVWPTSSRYNPDAEAAEAAAACVLELETDRAVTADIVGYVEVNVVDDDLPGVTISPGELRIDEGGSETYEIVLDTNPDPGQQGLAVTVTPTSNNKDVTFTPDTLTFTSANWNEPQKVTVEAAHDDDAEDDRAILTHTVSGYGDVTTADNVEVNVVDDDLPGVTVSPGELRIDEGGSETYEVVLDTNPDPGQQGLAVTVTPTSNNDDVTFTPKALTFTFADWNERQRVTVKAAHDDDAADDEATITHEVSGYGNVTRARNVTVVVNEVAIAPGAPRNLRATPGNREVTLTWSPPLSDGGAPIIRYEYQVDGGGVVRDRRVDRARCRRSDQWHAVHVRRTGDQFGQRTESRLGVSIRRGSRDAEGRRD